MANIRNSLPVILGLVAIGAIIGIVLTTGLDFDTKSLAGENNSKEFYAESDQPEDQQQDQLFLIYWGLPQLIQ